MFCCRHLPSPSGAFSFALASPNSPNIGSGKPPVFFWSVWRSTLVMESWECSCGTSADVSGTRLSMGATPRTVTSAAEMIENLIVFDGKIEVDSRVGTCTCVPKSCGEVSSWSSSVDGKTRYEMFSFWQSSQQTNGGQQLRGGRMRRGS